MKVLPHSVLAWYQRAMMRLALLVLALSLSCLPAFAGCLVARNVTLCKDAECAASAQFDFRAYADSERQCGVFELNLPFIQLAEGQAKGTVVLVHGLMANPNHQRFVARALSQAGYNVVVPILFGHGGTDDFMVNASNQQWMADMDFAGAEAAKLGGPLYLIGHSTGGTVAAVEAEAHPGRYRAFVGYDPALNLDGDSDDARSIPYACVARHVWNFPGDMKRGMLRPILGGGSAINPVYASRAQDVQNEKESTNRVARQVCGPDFVVPNYDYEISLSSLCALNEAVDAFKKGPVKSMPPSLLLLSQDKDIFTMISKPGLYQQMQGAPELQMVETAYPSHLFMMAPCSPGYADSMAKILQWLDQHR